MVTSTRGARHGPGPTFEGSAMLRTITTRDVGTAAMVVGLVWAIAAGPGIVVAVLLVVIGVGLRIEAAVRSRSGQPRRDDSEVERDSA